MRPAKPKIFASQNTFADRLLKERIGNLRMMAAGRLRSKHWDIWKDKDGYKNAIRRRMFCFYHNKLSSSTEI